MIVELNGLKFQKKATISAIMAEMVKKGLTRNGTSKGVEINIEEEYGLIQLKKSDLSSNKRAWVVFMFESQYELAPDTKKT